MVALVANEKDPREAREERNKYERARSRLKRGGRTDSIIAAIKNNTVPEPGDLTKRSLAKIITDMPQFDLMDANFEAMNRRQMAMGQQLQKIAFALVNDEVWRAEFIEKMSPDLVIKWLNAGIAIERQAMQGILMNKKDKERKNEESGHLDLAQRLMDKPELVDSVHDLVDDDEDEE